MADSIPAKLVDKKEVINNKKKLVLSGGGIKGMAMLGALKELFDGFPEFYGNIDTIAGSSVGSVIGTLLLIGYAPDDLFNFLLALDFKNLLQAPSFFNLFNKFGFDDGNNIMKVIKKLFQQKDIKDNITFKELYEKTKKKIIIAATCINDKNTAYFSVDSSPEMEVLLAVRMSISIPFYFHPVLYNGKYYVDGSCIDNFPVQLFNSNLDEVIGIHLTETYKCTSSIGNMEEFLIGTFKSLLRGINCNSLKGYEMYTINIDIEEISLMNLNIEQSKKVELFNQGKISCQKFLGV